MNVWIDQLHLQVSGVGTRAQGMRSTAQRALALLHRRLHAEPPVLASGPLDARLRALRPPPLVLDLQQMPDEAVARRLAEALYGSLKAAVTPPASTARAPAPSPMGRRAGR